MDCNQSLSNESDILNEEREIIEKTIASFYNYRKYQHLVNQSRRIGLLNLESESKNLVSDFYLDKLSHLDEAIDTNAVLAYRIGKSGEHNFLQSELKGSPKVSSRFVLVGFIFR